MAGLSTFKTILDHRYSLPSRGTTRIWILVEDCYGRFYYDKLQVTNEAAAVEKQDKDTMVRLVQHIAYGVMESIVSFREKNDQF